MSRPSDPVPAEHLRSHGTPEQLERVWERLRHDLPERRSHRLGSQVPAWIVAGAALFGTGVVVGARWAAPQQATVVAEPARAVSSVPSAGEPAREPLRQALPGAAQTPAPVPHRFRPHARVIAPEPVVEEVTPSLPVTPITAPPAWQGLADEGSYPEALRSIESAGGFEAVLSQATAEQLMLLVDVARATGLRDRTVMALRRVVHQHGSDPNAPLAAWMLGNELSRAGDSTGASQAFAMYRALSPQGDFAQDALTREFEAAIDQRDLAHAETLAEQYARDFPDGPRIEEMRNQLALLRPILDAEQSAEATSGGAASVPASDRVVEGVGEPSE